MNLKADRIAELLSKADEDADPLDVTPRPNLEELAASGAASLDLRLGCWISSFRENKNHVLRPTESESMPAHEQQVMRHHYVSFGDYFLLHPGSFVLGATLEWIRLPNDMAADVTAKSSWGRYGLIIATATGVHPGFAGCLTLELSNVGKLPIELRPGMSICQIFLKELRLAEKPKETVDRSGFVGMRRPVLGHIHLDKFAKNLSKPLTP